MKIDMQEVLQFIFYVVLETSETAIRIFCKIIKFNSSIKTIKNVSTNFVFWYFLKLSLKVIFLKLQKKKLHKIFFLKMENTENLIFN